MAKPTAMRLDDLHQVGANECKGDGHFERAEELWQGLGQRDLPEDGETRRAERREDVAVFGLERRQPDGDGNCNREKADQEGDQNGVHVVLAHKEERDDGHDRGLWDRVEPHEQWIERITHNARQPHDHAEEHAAKDRQYQPGDSAPERVPPVFEEEPAEFPEGGPEIAG